MLTIREAQLEVFRRSAEADFTKRLHEHLSRLLPREGVPISAGEIDLQISKGMKLAREFHLTRESDVARLVEIACVRLGGFGEQELPRPALSILLTFGVDPELKLQRFEEWAASGTER